jgi:hypothetical protein
MTDENANTADLTMNEKTELTMKSREEERGREDAAGDTSPRVCARCWGTARAEGGAEDPTRIPRFLIERPKRGALAK